MNCKCVERLKLENLLSKGVIMISTKLLHRFPFFTDLNNDHLIKLVQAADEIAVESGHYFFHEGDKLTSFYLVLEGSVAIVIGITDRGVKQLLSDQLTGNMKMKDVTIITLGTEDVFGWSALIPPHVASAGATAVTPCRVIAFDSKELLPAFEQDCCFGYLMTQKMAQVVRGRLHDLRIESLAFHV